MEWQACADEYAKLVKKMNTPRVVIDDAACPTATLVKVDSASRGHGILLDAIQGLTDLGLVIKKAYLSSDGPWFMDVFHVVDRRGLKLSDPSLLSLLESSLAAAAAASADDSPAMDDALAGLTALELTGADRPGLLSEVFAVLRDLECNVVAAKAWTHNARTAALIFVKDHDSGCPIEEAHRVRGIEARLRNVLRGDHGVRGARTAVSPPSVTHLDRRLHQMMFADRDYERTASSVGEATSSKAAPVSVQSWRERGYSVVSVQCRDRPKLLFDVVCTLTDMEYVVFHGIIDTFGDRACQEFYIRHLDGSPISSEAERQRVIQCLQAAIERRASEGLRLELCTRDRRGLLAEVTRTFRENGLSVTRAEVTTREGMAVNEFYVTDTAGHLPDRRTINAVIEVIGNENIRLNEEHAPWPRGRITRPPVAPRQDEEADGDAGAGAGLFSLGNLVMRNLYYLGLVRSCS